MWTVGEVYFVERHCDAGPAEWRFTGKLTPATSAIFTCLRRALSIVLLLVYFEGTRKQFELGGTETNLATYCSDVLTQLCRTQCHWTRAADSRDIPGAVLAACH